MLTAKGASWLAYRQDLRATMSEDQLALLDANMPKTLLQSCVDMGVPLELVEVRRFNKFKTLKSVWNYWSRMVSKRKQDISTPTDEERSALSLGLAALEDWCCSRAQECVVLTEEDEELDIF